jgi:hypothetical protein
MNEHPFELSALMEPVPGILSQAVVTYMKRDNTIVKITVNRDFSGNDYTDSMTTEVLYAW